MNREEALAQAWSLYNKYPNKRSSILSKLPDYNITVDEFNAYDSSMVVNAQIDILEDRAEKFEGIPGFSQVDTMSDSEILRVFETRDELYDRLEDIGRPPTDTEWYTAGQEATERIARLRPFYETKKAEEWKRLEYPFDPIAPLMGPLGALTEIVSGWTDFGYDFGERLHERGAFTSLNPLTGFGAWDIAEFKKDPETGQRGFSPELLKLEDELEELYGTKRQYEQLMNEGGYREAYGVEGEIAELNQIIYENKLLPPQLLKER